MPLTIEQVIGKRKAKAKGPNPLSVKKKQPKQAAEPVKGADTATRGKRKRADGVEEVTVPSGPQQSVQTVAREASGSTRKKRKRGRGKKTGEAGGMAIVTATGEVSGGGSDDGV